MVREFFPEGLQKGQVLGVDRAPAAEVVVVLRHLQHSLPRNVAAAEHVFQERHHIVGAIWAAERDEEHRVVVTCHGGGLTTLVVA